MRYPEFEQRVGELAREPDPALGQLIVRTTGLLLGVRADLDPKLCAEWGRADGASVSNPFVAVLSDSRRTIAGRRYRIVVASSPLQPEGDVPEFFGVVGANVVADAQAKSVAPDPKYIEIRPSFLLHRVAYIADTKELFGQSLPPNGGMMLPAYSSRACSLAWGMGEM